MHPSECHYQLGYTPLLEKDWTRTQPSKTFEGWSSRRTSRTFFLVFRRPYQHCLEKTWIAFSWTTRFLVNSLVSCFILCCRIGWVITREKVFVPTLQIVPISWLLVTAFWSTGFFDSMVQVNLNEIPFRIILLSGYFNICFLVLVTSSTSINAGMGRQCAAEKVNLLSSHLLGLRQQA